LKDTKFVKGYDFNDRVEADDDNGHGTHVAGAQSTNNGYGVAACKPA